MVELSSEFHYFSYFLATADIVIEVDELDFPYVELIHLNDLDDDVTFIFSTNQRPRNYIRRYAL